MAKYNIGPFATDSAIYDFCVANKIKIEQKVFERYGLYWSADLNSEEATLFKLTFTHRRFFSEYDEKDNEIL